ncbi:MAG TPA: polyprenyl synthetase family protein [Treponema sp.]|nr:MAG: polyprenyl synthetase [Treponema sp. GWC1_61_84]OHE71656.1 MAG: polyprenyl synthetase [Treponema sp. RIFOXYC1_FULL_61_9]HCM25128.1 polyprenyl synthetase family protein [Treponema sp.]
MDEQYTFRLEKIEAVLRARLPELPGGDWIRSIFDPLPHEPPAPLLANLGEPGRELVSRGGKRWRPLFMTLTCEAMGGGDAALPIVPLVEFPHNASLIHDDIEDSSDERRGKPAIHVMYGVDIAINAGCFLYFLPLASLEAWDAEPARKLRAYRSYGEAMRRLHLGQAMDISWHRDFSSLPSLPEYDLMCRMKTGSLARLSARLGACAAGADESEETRIGTIAESLGVGFQILDDVKNLTTGNPGKKRGDDIVEGKKSLPLILYLSRKRDRLEFVARCFSAAKAGGVGAAEVEELIAEMEASGAIEEARKRGTELVEGASASIRSEAFPSAAGRTSEEARELLAGLPALIG